MNKTQQALSTFRNPYSCAQTVYAAFKAANAENMELMRANSGGRAEGNMCGALFAATKVAPELKDEIVKEFVAKLGDSRCRELKGTLKVPCEECVRCAAQILENKGI